jgi:hypothetical protein
LGVGEGGGMEVEENGNTNISILSEEKCRMDLSETRDFSLILSRVKDF